MSESRSQPNTTSVAIILLVALLACVFSAAVLRVALTGQTEVADSSGSGPDQGASTNAAESDEEPATKDADVKSGDDGERVEKDSPNDGSDPFKALVKPKAATAQDKDDPNKDDPNKVDAAKERAEFEAPWKLQLAKEPTSWAAGALTPFNFRTELPSVETLQAWFEAAPRTPAPSFRVTNTSFGRCGAFSGIAKLRPSITEPVALRLQLQPNKVFQIHCFADEEGVTLMKHTDQVWSGYRSLRNGDSPTPSRRWLASTDDSAAIRERPKAPIDVCLLSDAVVLTRGGVELLRVNTPGLLSNVFLEGQASLQGISLRRITDAPSSPSIERRWTAFRPRDLEWNQDLSDKSKFVLDDEGATLSANASTKPGFVWATLPDLGLSLVEFELSGLTPGASVYLGHQGQSRVFLRFIRNTRDGELCAALRGNDQTFEYDAGRFQDKRIGSVPDRLKVRLYGGGGAVRAWVSTDGSNWAMLGFSGHAYETLDSIGLSHTANRKCEFRLEALRVAPLNGLTGLVDAKMLETAEPCSRPYVATWLMESLASKPDDIDLNTWRRATAIRSMQHWTWGELTFNLRRDLWADIARLEDVDSEALLAATKDIAILMNSTRGHQDLADYLKQLETALDASGPLDVGELVAQAYSLPLVTQRRATFPSDRWLRDRVLHLVHGRSWDALAEFTLHARMHGWERRCPLLPWADALVQQHAGGRAPVDSRAGRNRWPAAVVDELNRDTFNLTSELYAALDANNAELAAEIAAAIRDSGQSGLAPAADDESLLISISAALNDVAQRRPEVASILADKHSDVAQLRVAQAIRDSDADAMRTVAEQFAGSAPGGRASLWLGDHYLSLGRFGEARAEYLRAATSRTQRDAAQARLQLAGALSSDPTSAASENAALDNPPADTPVVFSDAEYSAAEFNALVDRLRSRQQRTAAARTLPRPSKLKVDFIAKLDGQLGKSPNQALVREAAKLAPDWPIRQLATTRVDDVAYVSNRFQVAAYGAGDGKRKWRSEASFGEALRAQDWFLSTTKPLVSGDAVYCRFLYGPGPMLARLNRADGKTVWMTALDPATFVVSDPWLAESRLKALVVQRGQQNSQLYLAEFEVDTGKMQLGPRLFELRDSWWRMRYCAVAPIDGGFVLSTTGALACCDNNGGLRWLRRHESAPTDVSPEWCMQSFQPPHVTNQSVVHLSPGSREVASTDLGSGRLNWSRLLPDGQGVFHADSKLVLVKERDGVLALNAQDGETVWRQPLEGLKHEFATDGQLAILVRNRKSMERRAQKAEPELIWLELATGKIQHGEPLPGLVSQAPFIGPLIPYDKGLYAFLSSGRYDVDLDLLRLEATEPANVWTGMASEPWTAHVMADLQLSLNEKFPGWGLLYGTSHARWGQTKHVAGANDVLTYHIHNHNPVIWTTRQSLEKPKKLRLELVTEAEATATVEVLADGKRLLKEEVKLEMPRRTWKTYEFDVPKEANVRQIIVQLRLPVSAGINVHVRRLELQ